MNSALKYGACGWHGKCPHDGLHDGSPSYVLSGVNIRMSGVAALDTAKRSLRLPVSSLPAPATGAGARGVGRVNERERYAIPDAPVFDKLPKLGKGPSRVLCSPRLSEPCPLSDVRQVFKLDAPRGAFSRFNKSFCDAVVFVFAKASLTTREFFEVPLSRFRTLALERRPKGSVPLPGRFDFGTAVAVAIGVGCKVFNAKVHAQSAVRRSRCFIGKAALQVDVPLAFLPSDELPALNRESGFEQVPLIVADSERHLKPTVYRRQTKRLILNRQDALVIVNRRSFEPTCTLPLPLADPSDSPNREVSRQPELSPNIVVRRLLQSELVEGVQFPRNSQNVVARRRKSVNRAAQALRLTRARLNFAAHA